MIREGRRRGTNNWKDLPPVRINHGAPEFFFNAHHFERVQYTTW